MITQPDFEEAMREAMNPAALEVALDAAETFTCAQNIAYSPGDGTGGGVTPTGDAAINFGYVNDHIVYTGTEPIKIKLSSAVSLTSTSIGLIIEFGLGKNGTLNELSVQQTSSFQSGAPKELTCQKVFDLVTGDELDFFLRQTSAAGGAEIILTKGLWIATKIGLN